MSLSVPNQELTALQKVMDALQELDKKSVTRILRYVSEYHSIELFKEITKYTERPSYQPNWPNVSNFEVLPRMKENNVQV